MRHYYQVGWTCLIIMTLAFFGCQTSPPNPEPDAKIKVTHPQQATVAIHVIGIREKVPDYSTIPFPAPGFAFKENRIVAEDKTETIAGTILPIEDVRAWMNAVAQSEAAIIHISPPTPVERRKICAISNIAQKNYTANYTFDALENIAPQTKSSWAGSRTELLAGSSPFENAMLVSMNLDMIVTRIDDFEIASGFTSEDTGKIPPLKIQLPEQQVHRWQASVLIPYGQSAIMAHWVRQYRTASALHTEQRVREHLVCLATAGEAPLPPSEQRNLLLPPETDEEPDIAEPSHYPFLLTWYQAPKPPITIGLPQNTRSLSEKTNAQTISDKELQQTLLPFCQNDECESISLGLAIVPGQPVAGDITTRKTCATGVSQPMKDDPNRQRTFILSEVTEGMECSINLETRNSTLQAQLSGSLGRPAMLGMSSDKQFSLRQPRSLGIEETYQFQTIDQEHAEISTDITSHPGKIIQITPKWTRTSSSDGRKSLQLDHLVLLNFGQPISPESPPL